MKRLVPSSLYGDYEAQLHLFTRVLPNGCWEFTGYVAPTGYGQIGRNIPAHRVAWEAANGGPAPEGLLIDHLCHTADLSCHDNDQCLHRRCVNPDHLEPVTCRENNLRGRGFAPINAAITHCPQGHEYNEENTYYRLDRLGRMCRPCRREAAVRKAARYGPHGLARPDSPLIRAWAIERGLAVKDRGSIPSRIRELYDAETRELKAA